MKQPHIVPIGFLCKTALSLPVALGRSARPLLNRLYFVDILCIFIEICWSIPTWCDAPPRGPLTFPQLLRQVVRPGAQQASWSPEPSFSLILQGFSSPGVMRNRSGSDLEGVGGARLTWKVWEHSRQCWSVLLLMRSLLLGQFSLIFRLPFGADYGNFQAYFQISYDTYYDSRAHFQMEVPPGPRRGMCGGPVGGVREARREHFEHKSNE